MIRCFIVVCSATRPKTVVSVLIGCDWSLVTRGVVRVDIAIAKTLHYHSVEETGHGTGTPTSLEIAQSLDKWAFVYETLDVDPE